MQCPNRIGPLERDLYMYNHEACITHTSVPFRVLFVAHSTRKGVEEE